MEEDTKMCDCGSGKEAAMCCADCKCGSGKPAKECCAKAPESHDVPTDAPAAE